MTDTHSNTCHKNIFYCVMQHELCYLQSHLIITQPGHSRNLKPAIIAKIHKKVVISIFGGARPGSFPGTTLSQSTNLCQQISLYDNFNFLLGGFYSIIKVVQSVKVTGHCKQLSCGGGYMKLRYFIAGIAAYFLFSLLKALL